MLLRRIADARVFNCEDDRGRLGVKWHSLISDGKTYSNECALQQKSCDSPKTIKVAYKGACGTVEIRSEQGELI